MGLRNEGHQSQPTEIDAGDTEENGDGIEMEGASMCVVRLAYILTVDDVQPRVSAESTTT